MDLPACVVLMPMAGTSLAYDPVCSMRRCFGRQLRVPPHHSTNAFRGECTRQMERWVAPRQQVLRAWTRGLCKAALALPRCRQRYALHLEPPR